MEGDTIMDATRGSSAFAITTTIRVATTALILATSQRNMQMHSPKSQRHRYNVASMPSVRVALTLEGLTIMVSKEEGPTSKGAKATKEVAQAMVAEAISQVEEILSNKEEEDGTDLVISEARLPWVILHR